jgi:hypothetical protein
MTAADIIRTNGRAGRLLFTGNSVRIVLLPSRIRAAHWLRRPCGLLTPANSVARGSKEAQEERASVTFRAPDGLSDVYTMSGRHISIDVDRLVHVSERDAVPLRQAGWQELENEVLANP